MPSWLDEAGDAVRQVIRAYHGSPHNFDRFDASKIGTGEGAQAYGHGMYFAGSEDTADFYRRKLAENGDAPERWARDFWAAQSQPDAMGSPEEAYDYLLSYIRSIRNAGPGSGYSKGLKSHYAAAEKYLLGQSPYKVPDPIRQGHMYEVEIDHPESALLNLDAPATGGHRNALMASALEAPDNQWARDAIREIASGQTRSKVVTESLLRAYNTLNENKMAGRALAQKSVSDSLTRNGIPGAMYWDQASRDVGQGTRNYVMFPGTEDSIRILRKYGLLAPVAAGAASQYDDAQ